MLTRARLTAFRCGAIAIGVAVGALVCEAGARLVNASTFGKRNQIHDMFATRRSMVVEWGIGYRPRLDSRWYDRYGARRLKTDGQFRAPYPYEKRPGITRLLFLGDSVTARGTLVRGLQRAYGEELFEYWNAGVEGYNTAQELAFYERYNHHLHPDELILTFHNNDFFATPVFVHDVDGGLVSYEPGRPVRELSRWWFQHSALYRTWVQVSSTRGTELNVAETRTALAELEELAEAQHTRLTILLLPILKPQDQWSAEERESRTEALRAFRDLGIRYFDLLPPLEWALAHGIECGDPPGDRWHPGDEVGQVFADYLKKQGLLEQPPPRPMP